MREDKVKTWREKRSKKYLRQERGWVEKVNKDKKEPWQEGDRVWLTTLKTHDVSWQSDMA